MEPITLRCRFSRERDHDAARRSAEAICSEVERLGGMVSGAGQVVWATLHPALPPIAVQESGRAVEARVPAWPGGPGYHEAALAMLRAAAAEAGVDLTVEDSTGFAESGDRAALETAHIAALRAAAAEALGFLDRVGERAHLQFGLPLQGGIDALRIAGDPPGVFTPLGRRDRRWLEGLVGGAVPAESFFPWWGAARDGEAERRLARALIESQLTWRPAKTERQKKLRSIALDGLRRGAEGAPPEYLGLLAHLEELAAGRELTGIPSLRIADRLAPLALGWTAVVPGHFEVGLSDAAVPPQVTVGHVHLDVHLRVESMGQAAPEGVPLDERIEHLFAQPQAAGAEERREQEFAGYAIERPLADGGTILIGSLVGELSHLIVRIVIAPGGEPQAARRIVASIQPERAAPHFHAI
ncbi:MAG: hypothetical protein EXR72_02795 [Myxococcales bacterium]|nr:hypothetical protein [Myxococcales bacterium]